MSEIRQIIGNEKSLNYFKVASKQGKLSHAYIICGQKGSGKKTFTENVAAGLLCEKGEVPPCKTCASCVKVETDNHPDIIHLTHEKPDVIKIDEIREQVNEDISIKPYYGPYKIYIINDAHLMNVNAQNALLKTLEEPPAYGLIFLLTDNPDGLLETVRSRCLKVDMDILTDEQLKASLVAKGFPATDKMLSALALASGNLGLAEELLADAETTEALRVAQLLTDVKHADAHKISETAKEYDKNYDKADVKKTLEIVTTWFRDVLLFKASGLDDELFFKGNAEAVKAQAAKMSYEDLEQIFEKIKITLEELNANVKVEAAMETLLLTIREKLR